MRWRWLILPSVGVVSATAGATGAEITNGQLDGNMSLHHLSQDRGRSLGSCPRQWRLICTKVRDHDICVLETI